MHDAVLADDLYVKEQQLRQQTFYIVSIKKFAILYLITVGLYQFYWFYKNWKCYKLEGIRREHDGADIWPLARTMFPVFFVHQLYREIKDHAAGHPVVEAWDNGKQATFLVLLLIVGQVLDRLVYRDIGAPYTDIVSFVILAPLLSLFLNAQHMINLSCNDPNGETNDRFTWANYVWIALGIAFWILIVLGLTAGTASDL
jgi:hypothetical protein